MTYLLMVMASTVNSDTATSAYLARGNMRQRILPCAQDRLQNVEAARGRLKQQNRRSEHDRFIMKTAVALRTCKDKEYYDDNVIKSTILCITISIRGFLKIKQV